MPKKNQDFQAFLDELKFKCDIVSIISQYVPLTKRSGRYSACCPFHNEKTPSFYVNVDGQYYHCFGCGASGNVFTFIMEMESLSFIDAVKFLADKAGMDMPEYERDPDSARRKEKVDVLKQIMRDAARYYRNNLLNEEKGREAREYLTSRGINDEVSARYGLGLSIDFDSMYGYMRRKGHSTQDLRECGLISGDSGADAFGNRIIVPIMNGMNEVIAFGGRIFHGEQNVGKYKNSANTPLFDKSRTIYGVNYIKKEKRENGGFKELILVEGYMDVISLGAAGIRNSVAGMGTALTDGQANELKRLVPLIYVCYDGDSAGKKAALKNVEPLIKCGLEVKVVSLEEGCDPDDTVRKEGYSGFMRRVNDALPVIEYKLKLCADAYDLKTADGRAKYVTAAGRVLESIESPAEREVYMGEVAAKSGVSVSTLKLNLKRKPDERVRLKNETAEEREKKSVRAARFVLNRLLLNAPYAGADSLRREWFIHIGHRKIYDFVLSFPHGRAVAGNIFDVLGQEEEVSKILDLNMDFENQAMEEEYYFDCLMTVANEYLSARLEFLKKSYDTLSEQEDKRRTVMEIQEVTGKLKSRIIKEKL